MFSNRFGTSLPARPLPIQAGNDPSVGLPGEGTPDPDAIGVDTVPEPASLTLLGMGGVGLAGYTWKRRKFRVLRSQPSRAGDSGN